MKMRNYIRRILRIFCPKYGEEKRMGRDYPDSRLLRETDVLAKEWNLYISKKSEFLKDYEDMYVAIKKDKILGIEKELSDLEEKVYEAHPYLRTEPVLFQKIEREPTIHYMRRPRSMSPED